MCIIIHIHDEGDHYMVNANKLYPKGNEQPQVAKAGAVDLRVAIRAVHSKLNDLYGKDRAVVVSHCYYAKL